MTRTVLIFGGGRGIGYATARAFGHAGYNVAVTFRNSTPPTDDFLSIKCDVGDTADVDAAFSAVEQHFGPVEIVVANAGVTNDALLLRMAEEQFASVLDTNLTGSFRIAKRASRGMLRTKWGRMIFISSAVALRGEAGQVNYAASKAGLVGLARSVTRELGSRNITANVVAPGYTTTDMTAHLSDEQRERWLDQIPLRRAAAPEEIAAAVRFLASDDAGYISGAVLPVDGGVGMGH